MGTPEFPNLGKHCTVEYCKQIDFLPFICDRCRQVFCLEHRSYIKHSCPTADKKDVTVVICPLCAKGVRLNPEEDANITWETHVNTDCDPSNYDKVTKKKKCPVQGCKEILTFSNTLKCKECNKDHCLKHRFAADHNCSGPNKPDIGFPLFGLLSRSRKEQVQQQPTSSSKWATSFLNAASSVRVSAEAGMTKLSNEIGQAWQSARDGLSPSSSSSNIGGGAGVAVLTEECPRCDAKFSSIMALVEHVEKVHEKTHAKKVTIDACPKCSRGFHDPVALVQHVERDHGGTSKAKR